MRQGGFRKMVASLIVAAMLYILAIVRAASVYEEDEMYLERHHGLDKQRLSDR